MLKAKFPNLSIKERLLLYSNVDELGCWLWQGTLFSVTKYGQVTHNRKVVSAHRLSMHVFRNFDLSSKDLVLHKCDVKHCINPDHLYIGDRSDNVRDAITRGRQPKGSKHSNAKLNEESVLHILKLLRTGLNIKVIAKKFSVSDSTIALIKRRKTWTHVKEAQL